LTCSLLHFSSVSASTRFLEKSGLLKHAQDLDRKILFASGDNWRTLHPKWDLELLTFLSKHHNIKSEFSKIISASVIHILNHFEEDAIFNVLSTIVDQIFRQFLSVNLLETVIKNSEISVEFKARINGRIIGPSYLAHEEFTNAISVLDESTKTGVHDDIVYYNAGLAYHQYGTTFIGGNFEEARKNFLKAVEHYDKAFSLNPQNANALSNKSNTLLFLRNKKGAKDAIENAIKISSDDDIIWYNKGIVHFNLNEWQDAIFAFDKTTSINEKYIHAWFYKAVCYAKLGNEDKAQESLRNVSQLDPNFYLIPKFQWIVRMENSEDADTSVSFFDLSEPTFSKSYHGDSK
jgi:tetratricopeptide (TPR) repeat protein